MKQEPSGQSTAMGHADSLLDRTDVVFYSVDLVAKRLTCISAACERIYGRTARALLDDNNLWFTAIHPDDVNVVAHAVRQRDIDDRFIVEYRIVRPDGTIRWVEHHSHLTRDEFGNPLEDDGVIVDASARKHTEAALRESNALLQKTLADLRQSHQRVIQQERLRAIGQVASGIAHDFNNVLAMILGYSELPLLRQSDLDNHDRVRSYFELINRSARDAAEIVGRLRAFYRFRDAGEPTAPVDLNTIVRQVLLPIEADGTSDNAQTGSRTVTTELEPIPTIDGTAGDLELALANVIANALEATDGGGSIVVRTRAEHDGIVVEVCDTGKGMSDEVRRRSLEPFFSTKGKGKPGMGLAVTYGIVQRHGGSIKIESQPGNGTTVELRFPLAASSTNVNGRAPIPVISRPLRVLVAEDEPLLRDVMTSYLAIDGHTVVTACDGAEALERFGADSFDLVITDRAMPVVDGDQVAIAVKQTSPKTPVILLTGFGDMMKESHEHPLGVDLVVGKPADLTTLRQAIASVIKEG